jgi:hypothetical protein
LKIIVLVITCKAHSNCKKKKTDNKFGKKISYQIMKSISFLKSFFFCLANPQQIYLESKTHSSLLLRKENKAI